MNVKVSSFFLRNERNSWLEYGTERFKFIMFGLQGGLVIALLIIFFFFNVYFFLKFGVGFIDIASTFSEHLVHLYNVVWIILYFVVFLITVLLIRIIYIFSWKHLYLSSDFLLEVYEVSYDFLFAVYMEYDLLDFLFFALKRYYFFVSVLINRYDFGLNLWYDKEDSWTFLYISDISEYRLLEVLWCLLPIGSLLFIATPTFSLIFSLDANVDPMYTVKIIGRQWYWNYSFDFILDNDFVSNVEESNKFIEEFINSNKHRLSIELFDKYELNLNESNISISFEFDSFMIPTEDLNYGTHRLLEVDNRLFLPVGVPIRLLVTASDVLHSWALPSLGVKVDAVPGRLNQFIVEITRPGVFYGQCSELCGINHGFMPIVVQAVSISKFEDWLISKTE